MLRVYAQPGFSRCPVLIVDLYLSKLPPQPKAFYMQPLLKVPSDVTRPWFQNSVMGVNPLKNMMPNICELAGLQTRYTNHSLHATATTRMFTAGVPEKIIADRTGNKSSSGLRQYEKVSEAQIEAAGLAVSEEKPSTATSSFIKEDDLATSTLRQTGREPLTTLENPPDVDNSESGSGEVKKILPTFTGNLQNCTINIHL